MDDEDHIVPQSAGPEGLDLMDETQDFRFLQTARTDHPTIPRRGEKDFESHGTSAQQSTLADSRDAMHAALSGLGLHPPSLHPTSPNPSQNQDQKTQSQRVQAPKVAVTATYDPRRGTTVVDVARGQHFRTLGQVRGGSGNGAGRVELMPEEALYLLERGNLDVFVRGLEEEEEEEDDDDGDEEGDEEGEDVSGDQEVEGLAKNGVRDEVKDAKEGPRTRTTAATTATRLPMSLQMAYTIYVGMGGLTLEEYSVYASLKRSGYIVTRTQQPSAKPITSGSSEKPASQISTSRQRGWAWDFWALPSWGGAFDRTAQGPLVPHGVYRSYIDVFRLLNATKSAPPTTHHKSSNSNISTNSTTTSHTPKVTYSVWKPQPAYKKSAPGPPDFLVLVLNARETDCMSLTEVSALFGSLDTSLPPTSMQHSHARLKHGRKNVILAIVDQGIPSFIRMAETSFDQEPLYTKFNRGRGGGERGGGRGGGGGGRGGKFSSRGKR